MAKPVVIRSAGITATIDPYGAEPVSLRGPEGHEYLWQGSEPWGGRSPVLFPIICRVPDDQILVGDQSYPMPQHGLARKRTWAAVDFAADRATFVLAADERTREHYPFDFALAVAYRVEDGALTTQFTVENRGTEPMPFSLGSHPAFVWPLEPNSPRSTHDIVFDEPEHDDFRRVENNLMVAETFHNPAWEKVLTLNDSWFTDGAMIMTNVASKGLTYSSAMGRQVRMTWEGFTGITVWTIPGAKFVCIEPWRGMPAPVGYTGQFAGQPGNVTLAAGERAEFSYRIELR